LKEFVSRLIYVLFLWRGAFLKHRIIGNGNLRATEPHNRGVQIVECLACGKACSDFSAEASTENRFMND
jgi:hypothetical protein